MFWGIAVLVMFVLFVTAKGELPIYISFFSPQQNTSDNTPNSASISPSQANTINNQPFPGLGGPIPNPFPVQPNTGGLPPFVPPMNYQ